MFRITAIAVALSAATAATAAPVAHAADDKPQVAAPSDFGCALRVMFIGSRARDVLKNQATPEDKRASAERLSSDSRRAFFYYIGRLGPEFSATNRSDEGKNLFAVMIATPKEALSMEIALCMSNAEKAERDALTAMKPPTTK